MQTELDAYGIRVVALSKDTVEQAATHRDRDGLTMTLLADPSLDVIRRYGVEHHKAVEFSGPGTSLFGLPLAFKPSFKTMAIPTTLLIDKDGIVRWVDQTDDYRLRSSEQRVMEAVRSTFE